MIDRDALAIEYSRQNAELNGLKHVEIYGSLGYDDVKRDDFDMIVANIPGKAGEAVIAYLLREARYYLTPGGIAAIVVVAALESLADKILKETSGCEIIFRRKRTGHAVFHYRFSERDQHKPKQSALERGVYSRQNLAMNPGNLEYSMQTAYGLPEFDSLSYGSDMMIAAIRKIQGKDIQRLVAFNPGQGHTVVALNKLVHPGIIELFDRDLLALRYSRLNLIQNGCPPERIGLSHQVGLERITGEKVDLIAGVLRDERRDANLWILHQAIDKLTLGGTLIITGGSTGITRLSADIKAEGRLSIKARERRRGYSLLELEKVK
jgi:16S rRNA G1207 methylase RsmC